MSEHAKTERATCRYLGAEEYPAWDSLVKVSPQGNVSCTSWWLGALPGDVRVLGYFRGDELVAGIPLYFEKRLGLTLCRMPKLVHTWGIVMRPSTGKRANATCHEMEILTAFADELAKHRFFVQSFHPTLLNWLPFYWRGFKQVTRFSYVYEDLSDLGRIWLNTNSNVRQNVRKAERSGIEVVPCDGATVVAMAAKTFHNQGKPLPYTEDYLSRLFVAANRHDAGACFAARDQEGLVHAALFAAWDQKRAYYLAGGSDPELRRSGAHSLLMWHLTRFSSERATTFDFSGSMVKEIEHFMRHFGAKLVPYNRILKLPRPVEAGLALVGIA